MTGMDRATVIQAFFACDKDEQVTVNYLMDHKDDFGEDEEDDFDEEEDDFDEEDY